MFNWRRRGGSGPTDDEIARELRDHLELEAEELARSGAGDDARYRSRRAFGNPTLIAETVRAGWRWTAWEQLAEDTKHGVRALRRSPAYTFAAVVTLALGIGTTTGVFSMTD